MRTIIILLLFSINLIGQEIPRDYTGTITKVYDGDSYHAMVYTMPMSQQYDDVAKVKIKIRLHGCDTYEIKPKDWEYINGQRFNKNKDRIKWEKEQAIEARDFVRQLMMHYDVELRYVETGPRKRHVMDVYVDGVHLCDTLRSKNFLTGKYEDK